MDSRIECDVLAMGGGPGATPGAQLLARHGLNVVIVEQGKGLGGTCLFEGCIPSKILLETAHRRAQIARAEIFGLAATKVPDVNVAQLMARKTKILQTRANGAANACAQLKITIVRGKADFLSPHEVKVTRDGEPDVIITAKWILAAPGSATSHVPIPGSDMPGIWNSVDALQMDEVPTSITIVGGGYIGCELATMFSQLGAKVHLLEAMPRLLGTEDPVVAQAVRSALVAAQVEVQEGVSISNIQHQDDNAWTVNYRTADGHEQSIQSQRMMVAVGRRPNTSDIHWDLAGIHLGARKEVPVNEYCQTEVPHIYAPGDVNGHMMLAHAATRQSLLAAQHILGMTPAALLADMVIPHVIFTVPEVASVGVDSRSLEQHPTWKLTKWPYARNARALIVGDEEGFAQVIWDTVSGQIKGMQVVGEQAGELIVVATHAITRGDTLDDLARTVHPHPVLYEVISELIALAKQEQTISREVVS
jgi:dihydrolipoamide dehydrogenase